MLVMPYSLRRLADAPHRLFFFFGTINLIAASLWWLGALLFRAAAPGWLAAAGGMASTLHPLIMIYGFFPFFIFGFAFTAGPRWLQRPPPAAGNYLLPGATMGLAFLSLYPAMFAGEAAVLLALALYAGSAGLLWRRFSRLVAASPASDKVHARLVQISLAIGGGALLYALAAIVTGNEWRDVVRAAGIWGFLVPLFCAVCHRMLPFFTASALDSPYLWRPWWPLVAMVAGSWLHGVFDYVGAVRWLWLVDGPMAFIGFTIVWRWGLMQSLRNRLLAMLHLSFMWLALAYTLSFIRALFAHAGLAVLGLGPLHTVTIGFLASITIAMVTRVTCGHSGRTLAVDRVTWALFLAFQSVAIVRVAAESLPAYYTSLIIVASAIWCACFGIWTWRHARIYLAPRADGMPG